MCSDIATYPGPKLVSWVWEERTCEQLKTTARMQKAAHARLRMVWSKLQLVKLLGPDFDLCVVIDSDTMAVQSMNELFWHQAPAAVWGGTKTILQGSCWTQILICAWSSTQKSRQCRPSSRECGWDAVEPSSR